MFYKVVDCRVGIHLRPASEISKVASTFKSSILLKKLNEDMSVDAKNIIDVTRGKFLEGDKILVSAIGLDEKEAVESVSLIIELAEGEEFE